MECTTITLPGGVRAIACRGRRPKPKCSCCKTRTATLECDYKIGPGKTCDLPLCTSCALRIGDNVDYCPHHRREEAPQLTFVGL